MTSFQETNDRERNMAVMPSGRGNDATIDADAFDAAIGSIGTGRSYRRKAVVYFENDRAECIYRVLSGSVFTYRVLADGRRQIVGLYLLGDFFGFEHSEEHSLSAEVVRDAKILVIKKKRLAALPNRHAAIERQLSVLLVREVGCMQDRILLLAKNAQERVVEFLYDMEKRTSANDLCRVAAVAPGHRRLSRSDNRNGFTHIKLFRILRCNQESERTTNSSV
jgi:CRP-like cAMP-binding protein